MRRRRSNAVLPASWRPIARERLRQWPQLDAAEKDRLGRLTERLLSKRWEAAHGFAIDDSMRITVAVQAALLGLGHDDDLLANVNSIVMHPTTMVLRGERPGPSPGVMTNRPMPALGHTSAHGPVFIAWDTVERELGRPDRSSNVVLHEFTHKIDARNGLLDGTPPLADRSQLAEWVEVCTAELQALRSGQSDGTLSAYAATNPAEFFAVATEMFFEQPVTLRTRKPRLYGVLARFYGQDPAARIVDGGAATAGSGPDRHRPAGSAP